MHHDDGRRDRRFKFKVRHVVLAVFAVVLAGAVLHMAFLSSGANRRLEALRAAGHPTSMAELALRNKLPMGVENAAVIYESAFAAYVPPGEDVNVPFIGRKAVSLQRGAPLPEPMAQVIADCLAANKECLALLHEATGIQTCRYEYDYEKGFPRFDKLRHCAQLLRLAAVYAANRGDAETVVRSIKDSLCLGDSLHQEPQLISYLVHMGCTGLTIVGLEQVLNLTAFTDSQLKDLDGALAATAEKTSLVQAMTTERCYLIDRITNPPVEEVSRVGVAILKLPGVRSQGLVDILDHMENCIEAAGLPRPQRAARFEEIQERLHQLSALHITAKLMAPAVARIDVLDSRGHAHLDLGRTALAIERYRLATGKVPEQLADLVPTYLEQVPIDPFDGQAIRYRRTEPGYVLYSIMEDSKDNGGKEKEEVGKNQPYDLCFIVAR